MEVLIPLIVVWLVFGVIGGAIGEAKGRAEGFLLGFVLGPIGLLIMALMPRSVEKEAEHQIAISKRKEELVREIKKLEARQVKAEGGRGEADKEEFRRWREEEEAKKQEEREGEEKRLEERERAARRVVVKCPVCGRENTCRPEEISIACKKCGESISTKKGVKVRAVVCPHCGRGNLLKPDVKATVCWKCKRMMTATGEPGEEYLPPKRA